MRGRSWDQLAGDTACTNKCSAFVFYGEESHVCFKPKICVHENPKTLNWFALHQGLQNLNFLRTPGSTACLDLLYKKLRSCWLKMHTTTSVRHYTAVQLLQTVSPALQQVCKGPVDAFNNGHAPHAVFLHR